MTVDKYDFGTITIDGKEYEKDVVIRGSTVEKRKKKKSKPFKSQYGHTPLTAAENIPWDAPRLVIGTGMYGKLPVTDDVRQEAEKHSVELITKTTPDAINHINDKDTNLILHLTC
jgi:hypothetical protein